MQSKNTVDKGLMLQLFIVLLLVILLVLSIFWTFLLPVSEIVASLALFVMAYNNHRIYKRKILTWVYIIFGAMLLLKVGWTFING